MTDPESEGRRNRRLPPISGEGDEQGQEERPKRRRRPRTQDANEEPSEESKFLSDYLILMYI